MLKTQKSLSNKEEKKGLYIIAVGASAGGLEAISEFLLNFPEDLDNYCIIIAQHLSPIYKSRLVEILSRQTKLQVLEAKAGMSLQSKTIYITPPDSEISLTYPENIQITKPGNYAGPKPSVDILLHSLSLIKNQRAIAVILSGTGSDGSKGVIEISNAGGIVLIQKPGSARYTGMPEKAIETGKITKILPAAEMGLFIQKYIEKGGVSNRLPFNDFYPGINQVIS
ncbi:MAG: chemotaxis protein CheB, partial [Leptospiraceae bacterium]|nr:chemotaxis protein CheB [Leptospiraceae bacterium]